MWVHLLFFFFRKENKIFIKSKTLSNIWTRLLCNSGIMPPLLSFLCKILLSLFTYFYLNFASQILSSFLSNLWILQRPINGKSAPPMAMVGQKRQRELWRTKPKWWRHRKPEKSQWIEARICDFSRLWLAAFRILYGDKDGMEITGVARSFDQYQPWLVE